MLSLAYLTTLAIHLPLFVCSLCHVDEYSRRDGLRNLQSKAL